MNHIIMFAHWTHTNAVCGKKADGPLAYKQYRPAAKVGSNRGYGYVFCASSDVDYLSRRPILRSRTSGFASCGVGTDCLTGTCETRVRRRATGSL